MRKHERSETAVLAAVALAFAAAMAALPVSAEAEPERVPASSTADRD